MKKEVNELTSDVSQILVDVRKSYRLLYQFQKRMLDLMSFIGGAYGLSYNGGYPKYSKHSPGKGKGYLSNWAWDWLNMYMYEFSYKSKKVNNDKLRLSVLLVPDTGYFLTKKNNDKIKRLEIDKFVDAEHSESKIFFVLGKNMWKIPFNRGWGSLDLILKSEYIFKIEEDKSMLFKSYNIEEFVNKDSAEKCIKDFSCYCKKNGVEFKVIENPLEKK